MILLIISAALFAAVQCTSDLVPMSDFFVGKNASVFTYNATARAFVGYANQDELEILANITLKNENGTAVTADVLAKRTDLNNYNKKIAFDVGRTLTISTTLSQANAAKLSNYLYVTDYASPQHDVYDAVTTFTFAGPAVILNPYNPTSKARGSTIVPYREENELSIMVVGRSYSETKLVLNTTGIFNPIAMPVVAYIVNPQSGNTFKIDRNYNPATKDLPEGTGSLMSENYPSIVTTNSDVVVQFKEPFTISATLDVYLHQKEEVQLNAIYNGDTAVLYRISGTSGWMTMVTEGLEAKGLQLQFFPAKSSIAYNLVYRAGNFTGYGNHTFPPTTMTPTTTPTLSPNATTPTTLPPNSTTLAPNATTNSTSTTTTTTTLKPATTTSAVGALNLNVVAGFVFLFVSKHAL